MSKKNEKPEDMTVKAVVQEAEDMRKRGEAQILRDVWAKPFKPSEAYARKLCRQLGPQEALAYLRRREAEKDNDAREHAQRSQHALKRLQRFHAKDAEAKRERDLGISPGARIDRAIARLATMSEVPAMQLDPNPVNGTKQADQPPRMGDAQEKARRLARACAEEIEGLVSETERRDLERAA